MSITELKRTINYGDFVVLWAGRDYLYPLTVTSGEKIGITRGEFSHDDMIGAKYGGKIYSKNRKGFVYALSLTPEIWTRALKFRTQILYGVDISVICFHLELRPGSVVLEAGTGSGSLSTSMARCIAPHGKLYTFEFNKDRVEAAKVDFKQSKIDSIVTVTWRDIYKDGFQTKETANAIFLDLPSPWLVIDSVKEALVPDGKFCGFSPCIEQVQKTSSALRKTGFIDIYTIECLIRPNDLKNVSLQKLVLEHHEEAASAEEPTKKRKTEEQTVVESDSKSEMDVEEKPVEEEKKTSEEAKPAQKAKKQKKDAVFETRPLAKPIADIRGHTGYLTFARKPVLGTNKT